MITNLKIIEVNTNGDFKIKYTENKRDRYVGYKNTAEVFTKDEDLYLKVNKRIVDILDTAEVIKYEEPVIPFETLKEDKINTFRSKANGDFEYNGYKFSSKDVLELSPILNLTDEQKLSLIPMPNDDSGYVITDINEFSAINIAYLQHKNKYKQKIVECKQANNETELNSILDD